MTATRYSPYDRREPERPVRLEKTEGVVVIEGRAYPAREVVEALAQAGYSELRAVGDALVLGSKKITPIFKSRQERAMASLCHGSLAYCCPLTKRCPERDRALEVLGLRPEEYERLKRQAHHQFLDLSRGMPPLDDLWSYGEATRRSVNRPAIDTGYGTDDYRQDFDRLEQVLQRKSPTDKTETIRWPIHSSVGGQGMSETSHTGGIGSVSPCTSSEHNNHGMKQTSFQTVTRNNQAVCNIRETENLDGLSTLFKQGELSPFSDGIPRTEERTKSFCFSCGRTIEMGTKRCPYCGALQ